MRLAHGGHHPSFNEVACVVGAVCSPQHALLARQHTHICQTITWMHDPRAPPSSGDAAALGRAEVAALDWGAADRAEATARLRQQAAFDYVLAADCCYVDPGRDASAVAALDTTWTGLPCCYENWNASSILTAG